MKFNRLFFAQGITLLATATIHIVALVYTLYFYLPWIDTLLHFLGGLWVGLFILWIASHFDIYMTWEYVLLGVILIGVMWELFEVVIGSPREAAYALDTSVDLMMDTLGGGVALTLRNFLEYE